MDYYCSKIQAFKPPLIIISSNIRDALGSSTQISISSPLNILRKPLTNNLEVTDKCICTLTLSISIANKTSWPINYLGS